ncbi:hypothetical protein LL946_08705 [Knoellia locipacati]|uniref:hypothetical protein n=1 Tax=Knoellia locipacati TaxID=882824 RepID=UPI00385125F5
MAKISLTVCDVDQDRSKSARSYHLTVEGRSYSADLCDEHAAPLFRLMSLSIPPRARKVDGRNRGIATKIRTMDEIEAEKRNRRDTRG